MGNQGSSANLSGTTPTTFIYKLQDITSPHATHLTDKDRFREFERAWLEIRPRRKIPLAHDNERLKMAHKSAAFQKGFRFRPYYRLQADIICLEKRDRYKELGHEGQVEHAEALEFDGKLFDHGALRCLMWAFRRHDEQWKCLALRIMMSFLHHRRFRQELAKYSIVRDVLMVALRNPAETASEEADGGGDTAVEEGERQRHLAERHLWACEIFYAMARFRDLHPMIAGNSPAVINFLCSSLILVEESAALVCSIFAALTRNIENKNDLLSANVPEQMSKYFSTIGSRLIRMSSLSLPLSTSAETGREIDGKGGAEKLKGTGGDQSGYPEGAVVDSGETGEDAMLPAVVERRHLSEISAQRHSGLHYLTRWDDPGGISMSQMATLQEAQALALHSSMRQTASLLGTFAFWGLKFRLDFKVIAAILSNAQSVPVLAETCRLVLWVCRRETTAEVMRKLSRDSQSRGVLEAARHTIHKVLSSEEVHSMHSFCASITRLWSDRAQSIIRRRLPGLIDPHELGKEQGAKEGSAVKKDAGPLDRFSLPSAESSAEWEFKFLGYLSGCVWQLLSDPLASTLLSHEDLRHLDAAFALPERFIHKLVIPSVRAAIGSDLVQRHPSFGGAFAGQILDLLLQISADSQLDYVLILADTLTQLAMTRPTQKMLTRLRIWERILESRFFQRLGDLKIYFADARRWERKQRAKVTPGGGKGGRGEDGTPAQLLQTDGTDYHLEGSRGRGGGASGAARKAGADLLGDEDGEADDCDASRDSAEADAVSQFKQFGHDVDLHTTSGLKEITEKTALKKKGSKTKVEALMKVQIHFNSLRAQTSSRLLEKRKKIITQIETSVLRTLALVASHPHNHPFDSSPGYPPSDAGDQIASSTAVPLNFVWGNNGWGGTTTFQGESVSRASSVAAGGRTTVGMASVRTEFGFGGGRQRTFSLNNLNRSDTEYSLAPTEADAHSEGGKASVWGGALTEGGKFRVDATSEVPSLRGLDDGRSQVSNPFSFSDRGGGGRSVSRRSRVTSAGLHTSGDPNGNFGRNEEGAWLKGEPGPVGIILRTLESEGGAEVVYGSLQGGGRPNDPLNKMMASKTKAWLQRSRGANKQEMVRGSGPEGLITFRKLMGLLRETTERDISLLAHVVCICADPIAVGLSRDEEEQFLKRWNQMERGWRECTSLAVDFRIQEEQSKALRREARRKKESFNASFLTAEEKYRLVYGDLWEQHPAVLLERDKKEAEMTDTLPILGDFFERSVKEEGKELTSRRGEKKTAARRVQSLAVERAWRNTAPGWKVVSGEETNFSKETLTVQGLTVQIRVPPLSMSAALHYTRPVAAMLYLSFFSKAALRTEYKERVLADMFPALINVLARGAASEAREACVCIANLLYAPQRLVCWLKFDNSGRVDVDSANVLLPLALTGESGRKEREKKGSGKSDESDDATGSSETESVETGKEDQKQSLNWIKEKPQNENGNNAGFGAFGIAQDKKHTKLRAAQQKENSALRPVETGTGMYDGTWGVKFTGPSVIILHPDGLDPLRPPSLLTQACFSDTFAQKSIPRHAWDRESSVPMQQKRPIPGWSLSVWIFWPLADAPDLNFKKGGTAGGVGVRKHAHCLLESGGERLRVVFVSEDRRWFLTLADGMEMEVEDVPKMEPGWHLLTVVQHLPSFSSEASGEKGTDVAPSIRFCIDNWSVVLQDAQLPSLLFAVGNSTLTRSEAFGVMADLRIYGCALEPDKVVERLRSQRSKMPDQAARRLHACNVQAALASRVAFIECQTEALRALANLATYGPARASIFAYTHRKILRLTLPSAAYVRRQRGLHALAHEPSAAAAAGLPGGKRLSLRRLGKELRSPEMRALKSSGQPMSFRQANRLLRNLS
uniref:GAT domain-containing protein n=1 Tax=Chromera velia CCMP2878 TaxID=1169474 RepID=A0A0G4F2C1_9ALVE|eukprot:Cvel_14697.t1-p1 / transcript=Cvel_14697.t1 / gene=Cvel_14697 / organism=Chromera_velia_CCMP2878 / gene_product=hypothetical protein / transcript_product=hypothetical protein / location=Cvel_scaffold1055:13194-22705(-) / protein_length=1871 / sequence_SO=supercontig / SO=protein_coding / is_pseudo=false